VDETSLSDKSDSNKKHKMEGLGNESESGSLSESESGSESESVKNFKNRPLQEDADSYRWFDPRSYPNKAIADHLQDLPEEARAEY